MNSNFGGLYTFSLKDQRDLESSRKSCPNLLLFFEKNCPTGTDFYPTEGGCSQPAIPSHTPMCKVQASLRFPVIILACRLTFELLIQY